MELNAEQSIKELDTQLKFAKFTKSNGVLISAKCAQFCLEHAQFYEQKIKELTEENERLGNRITCQIVLPDEKVEEIKNECLERVELDIKAIQADTVRKMLERITEHATNGYPRKVRLDVINQIAKEMLEGEK